MHSIQKIPLGYASKFRTFYAPKARGFNMRSLFSNAFTQEDFVYKLKLCAPKAHENLRMFCGKLGYAFTQGDFY